MKLENYEILEDDHEIIEILNDYCQKDIFKYLDDDFNNKAGMLFINITKNNIKYPAILLKFIKENDSGLGLIISNTTNIEPLIPQIIFFLKEFKINLTLKEFITQFTQFNQFID